MNAELGTQLTKVSERISPPGPARTLEIRALLELLLTPERRVGSLTVLVNADEAQIFLDGKEVGRGPRVALENVATGTHQLMVRAADGEEVHRRLDVFSEKREVVEIALGGPGGMLPSRQQAFLTGAGVTGAGVALALLGGIGTGIMVALLNNPKVGGPDENGKDIRNVLQNVGRLGLVAAAGGSALLVGGGVTMGWALWAEEPE